MQIDDLETSLHAGFSEYNTTLFAPRVPIGVAMMQLAYGSPRVSPVLLLLCARRKKSAHERTRAS